MTEEPVTQQEPEIRIIEHTEEEYVQHRMGIKPEEKPEDKPADVPADKPADKPTEKPEDKPADKPADKPVDGVQALTQDTVDYKTEYEKLKGEVEKNKTTNPYTNTNYYKLDVLEKQDPEKAKLYQRLVFGDPDPKELWKLNFLKDHPDATQAQVQRRLEKRFPALFDGSLTAEDADYKDASDDLDLEAKSIKRDMMKEFDAIQVPDPVKADETAANEVKALVEEWKPSFARMTGETKFTVEIGDGDQKETYDFDIPEAERRKYFESAAQYLLSNRIKADPAGYQKVRDFMIRSYVAANYNTMIATVAKSVSTKKEEEMLKKVTNSSTIQKPQAAAPGGGALSHEEIAERNIAAAEQATQR